MLLCSWGAACRESQTHLFESGRGVQGPSTTEAHVDSCARLPRQSLQQQACPFLPWKQREWSNTSHKRGQQKGRRRACRASTRSVTLQSLPPRALRTVHNPHPATSSPYTEHLTPVSHEAFLPIAFIFLLRVDFYSLTHSLGRAAQNQSVNKEGRLKHQGRGQHCGRIG